MNNLEGVTMLGRWWNVVLAALLSVSMLLFGGTSTAMAADVPGYPGTSIGSQTVSSVSALPLGADKGVSLPGIKGIPSISVGPQPTPPSSYTTIREAEPGQPTVVIVGGTDDQDSSQQLERLRSSLPRGVGIKTITSPQSVGFGWDGILVIGTGAYTYKTSLEAGVAATKAAILASDGSVPVSVVGYSQGATIAHMATQQLAAAGMLPADTTVATFGDPNTPNTGLANWAPAFTPGMPSSPFDVTNAAAPTTITNLNTDTWSANVSSNPLVALFYLVPGAIVHGMGYDATDLERWSDTSTVTQVGDKATLIVLHPTTPAGNVMNPWSHAVNLLLRQAGQPELSGPVYEAINQALNVVVPLGESGQPTKVFGLTIPTLNELTQPLAGVGQSLDSATTPQSGILRTEQSNDVDVPLVEKPVQAPKIADSDKPKGVVKDNDPVTPVQVEEPDREEGPATPPTHDDDEVVVSKPESGDDDVVSAGGNEVPTTDAIPTAPLNEATTSVDDDPVTQNDSPDVEIDAPSVSAAA